MRDGWGKFEFWGGGVGGGGGEGRGVLCFEECGIRRAGVREEMVRGRGFE